MMVARRLSTLCLAVLSSAICAAHASDDFSALRAEAQRLEHGEGMPKDTLRAFELYCEAAAKGDAESQYRLGWMYVNGRGVLRNDELAAAFFELAAHQGHEQSRSMLARLPAPAADLPECMRAPPIVAEYDDQAVVLAQEMSVDDGAAFLPVTAEQQKVAALVRDIAPQYKVSPLLALAFIRVESNFDARATSPKNAQGLMQLIPETSARFKVKRPYDPVQNLRGGLAYLQWLLAYFRGNVPLVAAAYNAGERAVERYHGVPPYAETREYVKRVLTLFGRSEHPFDPDVADPSPELHRMKAVKAPPFTH